MNVLSFLSVGFIVLAFVAVFFSMQNYNQGISDHYSYPTLATVLFFLGQVAAIVDGRLRRIEKKLEELSKGK